MVKYLYSVLAVLAFAGYTKAQIINLTNSQSQVVNGQLITVSGQADAPLLTCSLFATRNGATSANVNVKRYELNVQANTQNYFCWGVCYDATPSGTLPFWGAGQEAVLPMAPGVTLDNFHAYHVPMGVSGQSTYRYVWYNTAQATDTVYVDIRFDVTAVGIEEAAASTARIEAFPSPAIGQDATVDINLDKAATGTQLIVHDMLGVAVKRMAIGVQQARITLPTSEWTPGIYFISVQRNGALLATRRLVVAR
ncbi:MAG: T9SS type A sorting domain-containing protein [Flavobacteriales bacterium]|nr:T9SS type A sorting domain-containing protein [Flavobacteriales bacterium]